MCFPSSKAGGRRLYGSHISFLNNMGNTRLQDLRAALCIFAVVLMAVGCVQRGHEKGSKRSSGAAKDAGAAAGVHLSTAPKPPAMALLPEVPTASGKTAQRGGSLRVHLESEPPHLNPLLDTLQVVDRVTRGLIYETLIECRGGRYWPGLADSWEISNDGLRLTLHLKPATRWQDDKVFSAIDVQATLEPLLRSSGASSLLHTMLADVEGADVLPDHMVRLRLLRPSDLTLRALCEVPILPAEALRGGSTRVAQLGRWPVGTGPFKLASWDRGKRIRLARNRAADAPGGPHLDEIVFDIDTDTSRALIRVRRGEIDVLPRVLDVHYPEQVSQATLRETLDLYLLTPERYSFIALNTRRGVLADANVRHALSLLWDRVRFAGEFHHGLVRPVGAPTFGEAPADPFDRVEAGRLLDQAGFKDTDGDGVREVGGAPIRLAFLSPSSSHTLSLEIRAFAMDLRRAGILLDTTSVDSTALVSRVERGEFDLTALTWDGRKDEDVRLLVGAQGDYQYTGYHSERFSWLVDQLRNAASPLGRAPLLQQLAEVLATDRPALFLYRHDVPALVGKRVHGLAAIGDQLDFRSVWVDP
jgi:peptide/nickel transport system substrate-binding protein